MARCPDCNKFVGLEMQDPETEDIEISADAEGVALSQSVRIVRNCAECGTEMKSADLELTDNVTWEEMGLKAPPEGYGKVEVEETGVEQIEEGGGRYKKSFFGATVAYKITLNGKVLHEGDMSESVAASHMDEAC